MYLGTGIYPCTADYNKRSLIIHWKIFTQTQCYYVLMFVSECQLISVYGETVGFRSYDVFDVWKKPHKLFMK